MKHLAPKIYFDELVIFWSFDFSQWHCVLKYFKVNISTSHPPSAIRFLLLTGTECDLLFDHYLEVLGQMPVDD